MLQDFNLLYISSSCSYGVGVLNGIYSPYNRLLDAVIARFCYVDAVGLGSEDG